MKKLLAIFALLASVLTARAELSVEWIDGNTIRVSGDGYTVVTNNVYTNCLGTCTNCLAISPGEMRAIKSDILQLVDDSIIFNNNIVFYASSISNSCLQILDDISTFQRFGNSPAGGFNFGSPDYLSFSNYVYTTSNSQTALDLSNIPLNFGSSSTTRNAASSRWVGYNNGIYDYANTIVKPNIESQLYYTGDILSNSEEVGTRLSVIRSTVDSITEESCQGCSGGGGGGAGGDGGDGGDSCGDCPCKEQLDAIKDYVKHINDDFHVQLEGMADVTNFIPRMDSYAKLVSGILYNDATIVVDDGENSWSNVYRRGYSDLYEYDKSNILQRIELLLFGLTPISTTTNWGEVADIESDSVNVQQQINDVGNTISEGHDGLSENVTTIRGKISTLFNTLNFFGSSNMSTFTLNDPFQVFDVYEIDGVEPNDIDGLESFRNLIRSCFQVVYWVSGIAFMIAFWYFVVSFVVHRVFGFLKFFNNLLT